MKDNMITAFNKVKACIDTSETLEQLATTRKLVENFMKLYNNDGGGGYIGYMTSRCNSIEYELSEGLCDE